MADFDDLKIPIAMRVVAGAIVDARQLPPQVQAQAFDLGVIPYIPAPGTRASPASPVSGTLTCTTATMSHRSG
jgi:hypothetical protein